MLLPPAGGGLLTLCPCSSVRSFSQETVLHKLLQRESFPRAPALQELSQHGSLPRGAGLDEQAALVWAPHGVTASFRHPPAPAWGPFSMGYRWRSAPLWPPWTTGEQPASPWSSSGVVREGSLLRHFGHLLPPFLLHGPWCLQSCFSHIVSLLFLTAVSPRVCFLPFLKYVIPEAPPPSLLGLALGSGRSVLEPAGTGFIKHRASFWQLLTEATAIAPLLPKPCRANP